MSSHARPWSLTVAALLLLPCTAAAQDGGIPEPALERMKAEVGTWTADNAEYASEDEPFDAYAIEWTWNPGRTSLAGRLFGLRDGRAVGTFWTFQQFWHPAERSIVVQQLGLDGTFGTGASRTTAPGVSELIQVFYSPDGSTREERHVTQHETDVRRGTSFHRVDGKWVERRTYTWVRKPEPADAVGAMDSADGEGMSLMRALRKEITIAAPIDEVWKVWTDADALTFLSARSNIELRIGGPYEWFLDLPADENGRRGGEGSRVLAFLPQEMLAFDWTFPPAVATLRSSQAKTQVVVRFDQDAAGTRIRFAQIGWKDGEDWDAGYAYFDAAWDYVLTAMKGHLEDDDTADG